jgi:hypothetical protein
MTGWRELAIGINAAVVFAEYTPAPTPAARLPPARPTRPAGRRIVQDQAPEEHHRGSAERRFVANPRLRLVTEAEATCIQAGSQTYA